MKSIKQFLCGFVVLAFIGNLNAADTTSPTVENAPVEELAAEDIKALRDEFRKLKAKVKKTNYTGSSWERYCEIQAIFESLGAAKSGRIDSQSSDTSEGAK